MALVGCVVSGTAFKRRPEYHGIAFAARGLSIARVQEQPNAHTATWQIACIVTQSKSPLFWPHVQPNKDFTYQCPPTTGAQQPNNLQSYGLLL